VIRLGTRGSKLALIQVELVRPLLLDAGFWVVVYLLTGTVFWALG
jgi:porphobilinogen deaminase